MKLFVDDLRDPPDESWTVVRTIQEAQLKLAVSPSRVVKLSLDHDMGNDQPQSMCSHCNIENCDESCVHSCHEPNGSYLVNWMAETGFWPVEPPTVHSANPVGAAYMRGVIDRYYPNNKG